MSDDQFKQYASSVVFASQKLYETIRQLEKLIDELQEYEKKYGELSSKSFVEAMGIGCASSAIAFSGISSGIMSNVGSISPTYAVAEQDNNRYRDFRAKKKTMYRLVKLGKVLNDYLKGIQEAETRFHQITNFELGTRKKAAMILGPKRSKNPENLLLEIAKGDINKIIMQSVRTQLISQQKSLLKLCI